MDGLVSRIYGSVTASASRAMALPRRFLFAIRPYAPDQGGGSARSTQNLAEALMARGHEVHVVRLVPKGGAAAAEREATAAGLMEKHRPTLHFQPIRNIYGPYDDSARHTAVQKLAWHLIDLHNPAAARDFRALVRRVRPDIVNTSVIDGFSGSIFAAARTSGAKLIHTMRDYYLLCSRSGMFRHGQRCETLCGDCRIHAAVQRRHARNVDLFLANSRFVAEEHAHYGTFPAGRPVEVQWNVNEHSLAERPLTIGPDRMVFGFIGRIAPTKGVEQLLDATMLQAERAGRDWELRIAGDGDPEYVDALKARYDNSRVRFVGWADAAEFYTGIDVLVCPSTYNEPLPRVIYEGYGFGLPVIAAASGGIPEIVQDGVTGLLYEPGDIARLADHLARFRAMESGEYVGFSTAALASAAPFTPAAAVATYEARVEALLAGGAAA